MFLFECFILDGGLQPQTSGRELRPQQPNSNRLPPFTYLHIYVSISI